MLHIYCVFNTFKASSTWNLKYEEIKPVWDIVIFRRGFCELLLFLFNTTWQFRVKSHSFHGNKSGKSIERKANPNDQLYHYCAEELWSDLRWQGGLCNISDLEKKGRMGERYRKNDFLNSYFNKEIYMQKPASRSTLKAICKFDPSKCTFEFKIQSFLIVGYYWWIWDLIDE